MSFESDIHMALCVLKVFALLVIAYSLWQLTPSNQGYLIKNKGGMATAAQSVVPGPYGSSLPGYGPTSGGIGFTESSQAGVGNATFRNPGYEPPMWNNTGDISMYEGAQAKDAKMGIIAYDNYDKNKTVAMAPSVGNMTDGFITPY